MEKSDEYSTRGSSQHPEEARLHRKLWRAVLLQVLTEAEGVPRSLMDLPGPHVKNRQTYLARKWLVMESEDLRMVCDLADLDRKRLIEYSRGKYGK